MLEFVWKLSAISSCRINPQPVYTCIQCLKFSPAFTNTTWKILKNIAGFLGPFLNNFWPTLTKMNQFVCSVMVEKQYKCWPHKRFRDCAEKLRSIIYIVMQLSAAWADHFQLAPYECDFSTRVWRFSAMKFSTFGNIFLQCWYEKLTLRYNTIPLKKSLKLLWGQHYACNKIPLSFIYLGSKISSCF